MTLPVSVLCLAGFLVTYAMVGEVWLAVLLLVFLAFPFGLIAWSAARMLHG